MRYEITKKPYEGEDLKPVEGETYDQKEKRERDNAYARQRHELETATVTFYEEDEDDDGNEINGEEVGSYTYEELLRQFWSEYWDEEDLDPDSRPTDSDMLDEYAGSLDSPSEILQRAFYGHDYNPWHEKDEFNPNKEWFAFNGYGNLVSIDDGWLDTYLSDYIGLEEIAKWVAENKDEGDL